MKTQRTTNWFLGLVMLTAGWSAGLAQNGPESRTSSTAEPASTAATTRTVAPPITEHISTNALVFGLAADSFSNTRAATPRLSPWTTEMVKLARAGIEDRVMLFFIETAGTFNLGADQIIHLNEVGISSDVITAMLQHDFDLASGARPATTVIVPRLDPALEKMLVGLRELPTKASPPPPTSPAPLAADKIVVSGTLILKTPPGEFVIPENAAPAPPDDGMRNSGVPQATELSPPKPAGFYRVPETRSVQLAPPILVLNAASPTPNLVVLDLFPSSR